MIEDLEDIIWEILNDSKTTKKLFASLISSLSMVQDVDRTLVMLLPSYVIKTVHRYKTQSVGKKEEFEFRGFVTRMNAFMDTNGSQVGHGNISHPRLRLEKNNSTCKIRRNIQFDNKLPQNRPEYREGTETKKGSNFLG